MATKFSDFLGLSPTREITSPAGSEIILVSEPQGTSPETYVTKYVLQSNIGGGGSSTVDSVDVTGDRTLQLSDANKILYCEISGSPLADITITIPTNASVAFDTGTIINVVLTENGGASPANKVVLEGDTGVTLNGTSAGSVNLEGNYSALSVHKKATDEWVAVGGIS